MAEYLKTHDINSVQTKRVILFGNNAYLWSTENGYEFFVEQSLPINEKNYNTLNDWIDTYGTDSGTLDAIRSIGKLGSAEERQHSYIELAKQRGTDVYTSANSRVDEFKRLETSNSTGVNGDSLANIESQGIETFITPRGEVYGFVDKAGNIYLDTNKTSPEHPIHEYTHLWDRAADA